MLKGYKYRIEPTNEQAILINKHIGSCRFLYNLALETKQLAYSGTKTNLSFFDLADQLPELKKELEWLTEINSQSLQGSLRNLENAFTKFFKGQSNFPTFKSKSGRQSFQVPQHTEVDFKNNKLHLPKFKGGIKIILHRKFKGEVKTITISKTPTGKYFASILVDNKKKEFPKPKKIKEKTSIGVDLGIINYIATSAGQKIDNPRYLRKSLDRISVLKHRMRNKRKGSNKQKKAYNKIALLYEKSANQRKDFLHKLSTNLIKNHDTICIENLDIKGMSAKNTPKKDATGKYLPNGQEQKSSLNKSILDAGWGMFVEMLKYKSEWNGKNILQIGRWDLSTETCCNCGNVNHNLTLKDREWTCDSCKTKHDRDICAAINIKNFALKNSGLVRAGAPVELPTLVGTMKREASNPLG